MNTQRVLAHLARRIPGFTPRGSPAPLSGGFLNDVWRVPGEPGDLIVKHTPPHVASMPEVALDPGRAAIEARAMAVLGAQGALKDLASNGIRPPELLDYSGVENVIVMEDVGEAVDLGAWIRSRGQSATPAEAAGIGERIGRFIGSLHRRTAGDPAIADRFDNSAIQRSRLDIQYRSVAATLREAGVPDADRLGEAAVRLGEALLERGACLIMGDLWPASILVTPRGLRVIDWELAHYGQPIQDVAHLAAHLWMHAQRAPTPQGAAAAASVLDSFLSAYGTALGGTFETIFGARGLCWSAMHFGCEVLARAAGRFRSGYLYDGLAQDDPNHREAIEVASDHLRHPGRALTFLPIASAAAQRHLRERVTDASIP